MTFVSKHFPIFGLIRIPGTCNPVSRWLLIFSFKCLCRYDTGGNILCLAFVTLSWFPRPRQPIKFTRIS